jgi:hypothetical protein
MALEFARVVQGGFALLTISTNFSKSSREGFWPESMRKNTGWGNLEKAVTDPRIAGVRPGEYRPHTCRLIADPFIICDRSLELTIQFPGLFPIREIRITTSA